MKLALLRSGAAWLGTTAAVLTFLISGVADASLIGDTVSVDYLYPSLGTVFEHHDVLVEAGTGDTVTLFANDPLVSINIEESSFLIDFLVDPINFSPGSFNGFFISDLDWAGTDGAIVGLDIITDAVGWDDSMASFTDDSVSINYAGLRFPPIFSMEVQLLTTHTSPIPEPGASLVFAAGLLVAAARVRLLARGPEPMPSQAHQR